MIDGAGEEEEIAACDQWLLPSSSLDGVSSLVCLKAVRILFTHDMQPGTGCVFVVA